MTTNELRSSDAGSSRFWYISSELRKKGFKTLIIGRKSDDLDALEGDNIISVKPLIKKGFFGNLIFSIQIQVIAMYFILFKKYKHSVIRGYHLIFIMLLLKLINRPAIYDFHGYRYKEQVVEGKVTRAKITKIFDLFMLSFSDWVIVITSALRQSMPLNIQSKSLLLPNGVDIKKFNDLEVDKRKLVQYNVPIDKKIVGFIGNWEAWINIEELIGCAKYFKNDVVLLIVGQSQSYEKYKKENPNIIFTGRVSHEDAIVLIKAMDICVYPYSDHTIMKNKSSRKTLEYLAAGKPIVASDVDGRDQFLKEGENVLLYKYGDPKELANKIEILLRNKELYAQMSDNNLELAKHFSWGAMIECSELSNILRS